MYGRQRMAAFTTGSGVSSLCPASLWRHPPSSSAFGILSSSKCRHHPSSSSSLLHLSSSSLRSSSSSSSSTYDYTALTEVMRFRGRVDTGYGRGGKKLGVPTANLPESQFASALSNVATGVYFGWAVIEGGDGTGNSSSGTTSKKGGRDICHPTVVNVGYSPTFAGAENAEKIIEAHLIVLPSTTTTNTTTTIIEGDFYNETMRLALSGFLREEKKFDSFPDLIAQIHYDIDCAKDALSSLQPFVTLKEDPFLLDCTTTTTTSHWIGSDGGDQAASWEYVNAQQLVDEIRLK